MVNISWLASDDDSARAFAVKNKPKARTHETQTKKRAQLVKEAYLLTVGTWGIAPTEFWRMHPDEWWWLYESKIKPGEAITMADKWQSLYEKLE